MLPVFPVICTLVPPIPLMRPQAVRGETGSDPEIDHDPDGSRYVHVGIGDGKRNGNAPVVIARANLAVPIAVRRPRSSPTRPRMHGGRTRRGAARAISSARTRTASGVRARDASSHSRTHRA